MRGGGSGSWCTDSVLFFYLGGENRAPYCVAVHVGCTCLSPDIRSLDRWVTSSIFFFSFLMFCFFVDNWYQYLHFLFLFVNFLNFSTLRNVAHNKPPLEKKNKKKLDFLKCDLTELRLRFLVFLRGITICHVEPGMASSFVLGLELRVL